MSFRVRPATNDRLYSTSVIRDAPTFANDQYKALADACDADLSETVYSDFTPAVSATITLAAPTGIAAAAANADMLKSFVLTLAAMCFVLGLSAAALFFRSYFYEDELRYRPPQRAATEHA